MKKKIFNVSVTYLKTIEVDVENEDDFVDDEVIQDIFCEELNPYSFNDFEIEEV